MSWRRDVCHCDVCEGRADGTPTRDPELELLAAAYASMDAYYADRLQWDHDAGFHDEQPHPTCRGCQSLRRVDATPYVEHTHETFVADCFSCQLSRDEAQDLPF